MKEENTIMTITKDMRIGDLLQMNDRSISDAERHGLCVLPVIHDGVTGRGLHGARHRL